MTGYLKKFARFQLRFRIAAALTGVLFATSSCTKGTQSAKGAAKGSVESNVQSNELQNPYTPNYQLPKSLYFTLLTNTKEPVPNIAVEFKAFLITDAVNANLDPTVIKQKLLAGWNGADFVMQADGTLAGNACIAGQYRADCVGILAGESPISNQFGQVSIGYTTPNLPAARIAVAMRVPSGSTAIDLIQYIQIDITSNEEFETSGRSPLDSKINIFPQLYDKLGRQVIKAGTPFSIQLKADGVPNTEPGKGFSFDFTTDNVNDVVDGKLVIVPQGTLKCEFLDGACLVPGAPFKLLKPTTITISVKPTNPKLPVKSATLEIPVITGDAHRLVLSQSPPDQPIQNACINVDDINKPCIEFVADATLAYKYYPVLVDEGGNFVGTTDTNWTVTGPMDGAGRLGSLALKGSQQTFIPYKIGQGEFRISAVQYPNMPPTVIKYIVRSGKPAAISFKSENTVGSNVIEYATKPFKVYVNLYDKNDNECVDFNDQIKLKLKLSPVYQSLTTAGLINSATLVDTIDHSVNPLVIAAGKGLTGGSFTVVKVPDKDSKDALTTSEIRPKILLDDNSMTLVSDSTALQGITVREPQEILIKPGSVTQTLLRFATSGKGNTWRGTGSVALANDSSYPFFNAGYDAGGNYVEDVSSFYWGVNQKYFDDYIFDSNIADTVGTADAVTLLRSRSPSDFSQQSQCRSPTLDDASQPITANWELACGIHRGLVVKSGKNTAYTSAGLAGSGRILAIPEDPAVRWNMTKILTTSAGAATKFTLEFRDAAGPATLRDYISLNDIEAGKPFKIFIHAKDNAGQDSPSYPEYNHPTHGKKRKFNVVSAMPKSWAGITAVLPNGELECDFAGANGGAGVCELPGTYKFSATTPTSITIQLTNFGIQSGSTPVPAGTFGDMVPVVAGAEARFFMADKKGGPDAGAQVITPDNYPTGISIKTSDELPFAVAVTDIAGNYMRPADTSADKLTFTGFDSSDGSYGAFFDKTLGQWTTTAYTPSNLFEKNDVPSDGLPKTPLKFYDLSKPLDLPEIELTTSKDAAKYDAVYVPQNRIGQGYAVIKSAQYPSYVSWPSALIKVNFGDVDHVETVLFDPANSSRNNTNIQAGECNKVSVYLHDRKHNKITTYTTVSSGVLKILKSGVDDDRAGDFSFLASLKSGTTTDRDYYSAKNASEVPGPYNSAFKIVGADASSGGNFIFTHPSFTALPVKDFWQGLLTITEGEVKLPGDVCLYAGQSSWLASASNPSTERVLQVELPAVTLNGITFSQLVSRGAGVQFAGKAGKVEGGTAKPHAVADKFVIFRRGLDHLHGAFQDVAMTPSLIDSYNDKDLNRLKIGVDDSCVAAIGSKCGAQTVFWHSHDAAHNLLGPANSSGFVRSSVTLPSAQFAAGASGGAGALGSPSTKFYSSTAARLAGTHDISATNTESAGKISRFYIEGIAGAGETITVTRTGGSTILTTDDSIGFDVKLYDRYNNLTGNKDYYPVARKLSAYWSVNPGNSPGGTQPVLLGAVGGVHDSLATAVVKDVVLGPQSFMEYSLIPTASTDWTQIAKSGESLTLNFQLKDNPGPQVFTQTINLTALHGAPKVIEAKPEHMSGSTYNESATVPFKSIVNLFDAKYNAASSYNGNLNIKLIVSPVYTPIAPTGVAVTATAASTIDHSSTPLVIVNGQATTATAFNVLKVPNDRAGENNPQILLGDVTSGMTLLNSTTVNIVAGPMTQTILRDSSNGGGAVLKDIDPIVLSNDTNYRWYLAGYDAGANYNADVSAKYWGVPEAYDDSSAATVTSSGLSAAVTALSPLNPDSYSTVDTCPDPSGSNQPVSNMVFCGVHRGIVSKSGTSTQFASIGNKGPGKLLAIPTDGSIKWAMSPLMTFSAGNATKLAFEFRNATTNTVLTSPIAAGLDFKIILHAQDTTGTDAIGYTGVKTINVIASGPASWGGLAPILPTGSKSCTFTNGTCTLPDTYRVTNSRSAASIQVEQTSPAGVPGLWGATVAAAVSGESRIYLADKKGGPDAAPAAKVLTSETTPAGFIITSDQELPFVVVVTDAGGNYIREATSGDQLSYDGFNSADGSLSAIFDKTTGSWLSTYTPSDLFKENLSPSGGLAATPKKFYDPSIPGDATSIATTAFKAAGAYHAVYVPQNRLGSGFAVVKSLSNSSLKTWPSPYITVKSGTVEHIETVLSDPGNPVRNNANVVAGECNKVRVFIHDKKHNLITDYSGSTQVALKLFKTDISNPNGVADSNAGNFTAITTMQTGTAAQRDAYLASNASEIPGPYNSSFKIQGAASSSGGNFIFTHPAFTGLEIKDWWAGQVNVLQGEIVMPGTVCLYPGQTVANQATTPKAERFLQVDLPANTFGTNSFPALVSRGAGLTFKGQNNADVISTATLHSHDDKFTISRGPAQHLHAAFADNDILAPQLVENYNDANKNPLKVGVTSPCESSLSKCGTQTIYWHTHDGAHNYIKPGSTTSFAVSSSLASGQFTQVSNTTTTLRSVATQIYSSAVDRTAGAQSIAVSNADVAAGASGLYFKGIPGPGDHLLVERVGGSTNLTTDETFGFRIRLYDKYNNVTGNKDYYPVDRTLAAFWTTVSGGANPSSSPDGSRSTLMGAVGGTRTSIANAVTRVVALNSGSEFDYSLSSTLAGDYSQIVKAGEPVQITFKLTDSAAMPVCALAAGTGCSSPSGGGIQSVTNSINLTAKHGVPAVIEVKPEHASGASLVEQATVPFKGLVSLFDDKYNLADTYSGSINLKLTLDSVYSAYTPSPPSGITVTSTAKSVLDQTSTAVTIANGVGTTTDAFNVLVVPNVAAGQKHPTINLGDVTGGFTMRNPMTVTVVPGPATQSILRNLANGKGNVWKSLDPVSLNNDDQYFFYVAGYDAGANYVSDISSKFWGVNQAYVETNASGSGLTAAVGLLKTKDATAYNDSTTCPAPNADSSNQPFTNKEVFCGIHRGLLNKAGTSTILKSSGIAGIGKILAIPDTATIGYSLSPDLPFISGVATGYTLELRETNGTTVLSPPIIAGKAFKVFVRAKDSTGTDAASYGGSRTLSFTTVAAASWGGIAPTVPTGLKVCTFNQGVCEVPGTYVLTDVLATSKISIDPPTGETISGSLNVQVIADTANPARLFFASKVGGPPNATAETDAKRSVGFPVKTATEELPLAVAVADMAGNYLRDADPVADQLTYEGFANVDRTLTGIFDQVNGQWITSYAVDDLFIANNAPATGLVATPKKFYHPSVPADASTIETASYKTPPYQYTAVYVPQNRVGKGYAVVKSSNHSTWISWPSPWIQIVPGLVEHVDTEVYDPNNAARNNSNILASECNKLKITLHDRKHNVVTTYSTPNTVALKLIKANTANPTGVPDLKAKDFAAIDAMKAGTSSSRDYYATHNAPDYPGPYSPSFLIAGGLSTDGGNFAYNDGSISGLPIKDWWSGNVSFINGVLDFPGTVCLYSGQNTDSFAQASPYDIRYLQVDLKQVDVGGVTQPAMASRGPGVTFKGPGNIDITSSASPHGHKSDKLIISRGTIDHLHPGFSDVVLTPSLVANFNSTVNRLAVGVTDACPLSLCGNKTIYWHTHDAAHNFLRKANPSGFTVSSASGLDSAQFAAGTSSSGFATTSLYSSTTARSAGAYDLTVTNGELLGASRPSSVFYFEGIPGPGDHIVVTRTGASTLTTDVRSGFTIKLEDKFNNLTGNYYYYPVARTLSMYWTTPPSASPDGTDPITVGNFGGNFTSASPVPRSVTLTGTQNLQYSLSSTVASDWTQLVKAGESVTLNFDLKDDTAMTFCTSQPGNCPRSDASGKQQFTVSVAMTAKAGAPKVVELASEHSLGGFFTEQAGVPFKAIVTLFDSKYNQCNEYSGSIALNLAMAPVYTPVPPTGISVTATQVTAIDHTASPLVFTAGVATTTTGFTAVKVPNISAGEKNPDLSLGTATGGLTQRRTTTVTMIPGPTAQTLLRDTAGGLGNNWKDTTVVTLSNDSNYDFYVAGYDAGANYTGDVSSKIWGVNSAFDDTSTTTSNSTGLTAAITLLRTKDPASYNNATTCPTPNADSSNQPVTNKEVFCGFNRGIATKSGTATKLASAGIPGFGRVLALPTDSTIKAALSPALQFTSGSAVKFGLFFLKASDSSKLTLPITAGVDFKIELHAQDATGTDATAYTGLKTFDVVSSAAPSWAGLQPVLPNGSLQCTFASGICVLPGTFRLTDVRASASISVEQTSPTGEITGAWAKLVGASIGAEARIFFASKIGSDGIVQTPMSVPGGYSKTSDQEIPFAVSITDIAGNYIRSAQTSDNIVYDGFSSIDRKYDAYFNGTTGIWTATPPSSDLFVAGTGTVKKFYSPISEKSSIDIYDSTSDEANYTIIYVPQNRIGYGYAFAKSTSNPSLIGWISPWFDLRPGALEHAEFKLSEVTRPSRTNADIIAGECNNVRVFIHDKKHNLVVNYSTVTNVGLKLFRANASNPNGLPDDRAGDFSFLTAMQLGTQPRSYYAESNESELPGPAAAKFAIPGASGFDGGGIVLSGLVGGSSGVKDWWYGALTIASGEIVLPGRICIDDGQTSSNYTQTNPTTVRFLQLELPAKTIDGISYEALTTRGAGITFKGQGGATIGSSATDHDHIDYLKVTRGSADHLHAIRNDSVTVPNIITTSADNPLGIGATDKCPTTLCGKQTIYWHTHDAVHNYIKPGSTAGFSVYSATLPANQLTIGTPGALGSPAINIFNDPAIRTSGLHTINVTNAEFSSENSLLVRGVPGPGVALSIGRTGDATLTSQSYFGFNLSLVDQFGNLTGDGSYYPTTRKLKLYWSSSPGSAPNSTVPILVGDSVGVHDSEATAIQRTVLTTGIPLQGVVHSISALLTGERSLLPLANVKTTLNFKLADDQLIPFCQTAGNCPTTGTQVISSAVDLTPLTGPTTAVKIMNAQAQTGIEYKTANYNTMFNTSPSQGQVYPLLPDWNRDIFTYACSFDAFDNIGNCDKGNVFSVVNASRSGIISVRTNLEGSLYWNPVKSGTFKIQAVKDGITSVTDLISVNVAPLDGFSIQTVLDLSGTGTTINAGAEIPIKVCMVDKANGTITTTVYDDSGVNVVTDPNATLFGVSFSALAVQPNAENRSMEFSTGTGADFDTAGKKFGFGSQSIKFTNGCVDLYTKVLAAGNYIPSELLRLSYIDPNQSNKAITGQGILGFTVSAGVLNHYASIGSGLASSPTLNTTRGWADPGTTNTLANAGGNRFGITIYARDAFGNNIDVTKSLTLSLVGADGVTAISRNPFCAAPGNGSSCLSASLSNSNSAVINNLAVDFGGISFYVKATDGVKGIATQASTLIYADSSRKTVKSYAVSAPANVVAGQDFTVSVIAKDSIGNTVQGADSDLGLLNFTWTDGAGQTIASSHTAPDTTAPTLVGPTMVFAGGASYPILRLTKAEAGLYLNIKDNQSPVVSSSNTTSATTVAPGTTLKYSVTCTKVTGGANCSGAAGSAFSVVPSASDKFNLYVQAYDQYKNPKASGENAVTVVPAFVSGTASIAGFLEQNPQVLQTSSNQLQVNANQLAGYTMTNLFHRSGNHSVRYDVTGSTHSGYYDQTFHTYSAHIDMVYRFGLENFNTTNEAGIANVFNLLAYDPAGNIATGVDSQLNAQTYTWFGGTAAPNASTPDFPASSLTFSSGAVNNLSVKFKKAESITDFGVYDNYTPSATGNGGTRSGGARIAQTAVGNSYPTTVLHGKPNRYVLTSTSTSPQAGVPFDVTVTARDQFDNIATSWLSDTLTFAWTAGASSSVTNPKTATVQTPAALASANRTFSSGAYSSSGTPFVLYRSHLTRLSPQEASTLTLTGTNTNTLSGSVLSTTLSFTTQPNAAHAYVKMTSTLGYNEAAHVGGTNFTQSVDNSRNVYAHLFDAYGNYKGNVFSVDWSGTGSLSSKLDPVSGNSSSLEPTTAGTGTFTASCASLTAGCVSDTSGTVTTTVGSISKLVYISPTPSTNFTQTTEACQAIQVQSLDKWDNPAPVLANTQVTFSSTGGNGDFYASDTACAAAQAGGNDATANTATFHTSALGGSAGSRTINILANQSTAQVWYANRTAVAANGVTITAISGSWSVAINATITVGPAKRFVYTSSAPTIFASGYTATGSNCGAISYKFQDKWNNDSAPAGSSNSTVKLTSSNSTFGFFYSDPGCNSQITSGNRSLAPNTLSDTVYYKDSQANLPTLTLDRFDSSLNGNVPISSQTLTATVNPGLFTINTGSGLSPQHNSNVKGTVTVYWGASSGAQNYSVFYSTASASAACSSGTQYGSTATTTNTNMAVDTTTTNPKNDTVYFCVKANGISAGGQPVQSVTTDSVGNTAYRLTIDNTAPTGVITAPASSILFIGPNTAATHSVTGTTRFQGTSADAIGSGGTVASGVSNVEVQIVRAGSNYWTGSSWTPTVTWVTASQLTAGSWANWYYDIADSWMTNASAYTVNTRVTDGSGGQGTATKAFTWDSSAPTVTLGSQPGLSNIYGGQYYSNATALGVTVGTKGSPVLETYVTNYKRKIVAGAACGTINWTAEPLVSSATNITDSLVSSADGQYTLCVQGYDQAENTSTVATYTWWKDTAAPTFSTTLPNVNTNTAFTVTNSTLSDTTPSGSGSNLLYSWAVGASNSCFANGIPSASLTPTISLSGCSSPTHAKNWGQPTVTLTVKDYAQNQVTQSFTLTWDQEQPVVSAITSTAGFYPALSALTVNVKFTKSVTNPNKDSFSLTSATGKPVLALNTTGNATSTLGALPQTVTNAGSGNGVTLGFSYTATASDFSGSQSGQTLNVSSTSALALLTSGTLRDNLGNNADLTTATSLLTSSNAVIDTVAPILSGTYSAYNALVTSDGYINASEATGNTSIVNAAVGIETLGSAAYAIVASGGTCDSSKVFSLSIPTSNDALLVNGNTYLVCLKIADRAGNITYTWATTGTISVDKTAPTFTSIALNADSANNANANDGYISGTEAVGTNSNPVAVSLTASNYDFVSYLATTSATCTTSTGTYGSMPTFATLSSMTQATGYRICVKLRDYAGNETYGSSSTFILDRTAPTLASGFVWTGDAANGYLNSTENGNSTAIFTALTAAADLSGMASGYPLYLLVTSNSNCLLQNFGGSTSVPIRTSMTADDTYKVCAKVQDTAGNSAILTSAVTSSGDHLIRDLVAPAVAFGSGVPNNFDKNTSFTVGVTSSDGATTYSWSAQSGSTCSASYSADVNKGSTFTINASAYAQGAATVCIKGKDAAGNVSTVVSRTWTKDTAGPGSFTISAPSGTQTTGSLSVTWTTATDATSGVASYDLLVDTNNTCTSGSPKVNLTGLTGNSYSISITGNATYFICMYANDNASNKSAMASGSFTLSSAGNISTLLNFTNDKPKGLFLSGTTIYFISENATRNPQIEKVQTDGTGRTTVAGCYIGPCAETGTSPLAYGFTSPQQIWVSGTMLYIADSGRNIVWRVDLTANTIIKFAGTGTAGSTGDGGQAASALLNAPKGVTVDSSGNVIIADTGNNKIRSVNTSNVISTGLSSVAGIYMGADSTLASIYYVTSTGQEFTYPSGGSTGGYGSNTTTFNRSTNTTYSTRSDHVIMKNASTIIAGTAGTSGFTGDGGPASQATFNSPHGVVVDSNGNIYIGDYNNNRIRKITP